MSLSLTTLKPNEIFEFSPISNAINGVQIEFEDREKSKEILALTFLPILIINTEEFQEPNLIFEIIS